MRCGLSLIADEAKDVKKKPSFLQLAKLAKVSTATVSRIARGQVNVDASIRARVRNAAEELGIDLEQRRNEKSSIIAFILANRDILHNFQARILFGAEAYCSSQSKELLFLSLRYSPSVPSRDLHLPQILSQLAGATYELFAGMIEFGLSRRLTQIVTVTDARMERILRRAGWPLRRIGEPHAIGNTLAVAGDLEVSAECLVRVRNAGGLQGPVLWAPVAIAAA